MQLELPSPSPQVCSAAPRPPRRSPPRGASVSEEIALVALQLDGEEQAVGEAIEHLQSLGVQVEVLS